MEIELRLILCFIYCVLTSHYLLIFHISVKPSCQIFEYTLHSSTEHKMHNVYMMHSPILITFQKMLVM